MKQHFINFAHKPKYVALISLVIAGAIGVYGYIKINTPVSVDTGTPVTETEPKAGSNLSLGFLTGGRIKAVNVKAGDNVTKGQELASIDSGNTLGALTQAKATHAQALANYQKIVNGATGPAIDVARASVHTAEINLSKAKTQQDTLVANARRTYLGSNLLARSSGEVISGKPTVSGVYTKDVEGTLTIQTHGTGAGAYFVLSGLATGTGKVTTVNPEPLGDTGLSILFPSDETYDTVWTIAVPNTEAATYITNYNAYQAAKETREQTIASLQAVLDQANASLTALVTAARPEDVAAAQAQVDASYGAIQIAQAAYDATIIRAPYDGTITAVSISVGQIATPNTSAIEFKVKDALSK
jgi:HlyD family secretion protein